VAVWRLPDRDVYRKLTTKLSGAVFEVAADAVGLVLGKCGLRKSIRISSPDVFIEGITDTAKH
jgi:hypothetical protein